MKNKKLTALVATLLSICTASTVLANGYLTPYISNEVQTVTNTEAVDYVEEFKETAPEIETMNLKIMAFDRIQNSDSKDAVSVLYAKGFIGEPDIEGINSGKAISFEEFSKLLQTALKLDAPLWENAEVLTRIELAKMIGVGTEYYRKRFIPTSKEKESVRKTYTDIKNFSDEEIEYIYNLQKGEYLEFAGNEFLPEKAVSLGEAYSVVFKMLIETDSPYLATIRAASSQVDRSATAGPEAIASSGSPSTSERTTHSTLAGAHANPKRPPLTAERCFTISAGERPSG